MNIYQTYRKPELVGVIAKQIRKEAGRKMCFMEVCGGHTHSIRQFGIPDLLPANVYLVSGPGCPVCVTNYNFIDQAVGLLIYPDVIICTYGDLIRVPGSESSLEKEQASGKDIRIVLSSLQALEIAKKNPSKSIVFLGIGFETTAPSTAAAIIEAQKSGLKNFCVYGAHKIMPPAMKVLAAGGLSIDGFICPGHVSTIAGSRMYSFLAEDHSLACVVSGFEPVDLMRSILMLCRQVNANKPIVEVQYTRAVNPDGNIKALAIMNEVFETRDDWWRGLGSIPGSGLGIKAKYLDYDAVSRYGISETEANEPAGCSCGDILRGEKKPEDCKLFDKVCTPVNPVGACMVSPEGACNASYKYRSY